jgi:polyphenol oxidase
MTFWSALVNDPGGTRSCGWVFSSRFGGFSAPPFNDWNLAFHVGDDEEAVRANRARLAEVAGLGSDHLVFMRQCHSADIAVITEVPPLDIVDVDGLVTTQAGIGLAALSADCVPVALLDPVAGVVGAVHSGWQGMVSDVVGAAVRAMMAAGADPVNMRVALGPAICGRHYPVPSERAEEAADAWSDSLASADDGQPAIDVRAGLRQRLAEFGISAEFVGGCTAEDTHLFSYRRDGLTGRQGVAVWLRE